MEFLSLSSRHSSSRNVPQRRWVKRNVCRWQALLIWMSLVKEVSRYWFVHVMFKIISIEVSCKFWLTSKKFIEKKPDFYWLLGKSCEISNVRNHISLYWCFFQIFNQSVIILVINAGVQFDLSWVCAYSLIWATQCSVTNINHNYDKFCDNLSLF